MHNLHNTTQPGVGDNISKQLYCLLVLIENLMKSIYCLLFTVFEISHKWTFNILFTVYCYITVNSKQEQYQTNKKKKEKWQHNYSAYILQYNLSSTFYHSCVLSSHALSPLCSIIPTLSSLHWQPARVWSDRRLLTFFITASQCKHSTCILLM